MHLSPNLIHYSSHIATIGVDFKVKTLEHDVKRVKTQIWDTAGQERFHSIVTSYYRGAQVIILVYDVTDLESVQNLSRWLADVRAYASTSASVLVIGNKSDKTDATARQGEQQGREFAAENGCFYALTSAKNDKGVDEAFHTAIHEFVTSGPKPGKRINTPVIRPQPVHIKPTTTTCC